MFNDKFAGDLKKIGFSEKEIGTIKSVLTKQAGEREKEVLKIYDSMEMEGNTILNIYGTNGEGFGIDARKEEKNIRGNSLLEF